VTIVLLACGLLGVLAAPANAAGPTGTVSVSGTQLVYTAAAGVANKLVFDFWQLRAQNRFLIADTAGRPTPGAGCQTSTVANSVVCTSTGVTSANIALADGDDNVRAVDGGKLTGGFIAINGGAGNDFIDSQVNGTGPAQVRYAGGDGNDSIDGGDAGDILDGGNGDDILQGDGSAPGQPQGNDRLTGGAGFDFLYGMGGNDTMDGGAGRDLYEGGAGADVVNAHLDNQADLTINCGADIDTASRDGFDAVQASFSGCETLTTIVAATFLKRYILANGPDRWATTGPAPGYILESTLGNGYSRSDTLNLVPLYGCTTGIDHFLSSSPSCGGQQVVVLEVFVRDPKANKPIGSLNLYQCVRAGDRFESLSSTCEGSGTGILLGFITPVSGPNGPASGRSGAPSIPTPPLPKAA
jgi:Ca2+-binding RTX toxin-like protein